MPVALGVAAAVLAASGGIALVMAPGWFGHSTPTRDVGAVAAGRAAPNKIHPVPAADISPRSIRIPAISAQAPIVTIGAQNRELQIPLDPKIAGWWDGGAKPGASTGTAVITGHINYSGVTGELAEIGRLDPGNRVYVTGMRGGRLVTQAFAITGVRTYAKTALPYAQIFDQHVPGRLAIVTCGGPFDSSTGNYLDNVVAYAVPV